MNKAFKKSPWLIAGLVLLLGSGITYAAVQFAYHTSDINSKALGAYEIAPQGQAQITGPDGVCRLVTNTSSTNNLFVPIDSTDEWVKFRQNSALIAQLSDCPTAPTSCQNSGWIVAKTFSPVQSSLNLPSGQDFRYDDATKSKVCSLAGYTDVGASDSRSYNSPGDNHVWYWDGALWQSQGASGYNNWFYTIWCYSGGAQCNVAPSTAPKTPPTGYGGGSGTVIQR